jgi:hypothetical protein
MAASQRLSRGLHRFGLFSAAILLIVGCALSVFFAFDKAKSVHDQQVKLSCARESLAKVQSSQAQSTPDYDAMIEASQGKIDLQKLGCSERPQIVRYDEIYSAPRAFSYVATFLPLLAVGLGITLAASLALYSIISAVVGVIGASRRTT